MFLAGNLGHLTRVRYSNHKSSTTHYYPYHCVFKQWYGCQCLGICFILILFYIQCTDVGACKGTWGQHRYHQRICTGSWFWKENPLLHRDLKPVSVLYLTFHNFSQTLYQLSCPHPHLVIYLIVHPYA